MDEEAVCPECGGRFRLRDTDATTAKQWWHCDTCAFEDQWFDQLKEKTDGDV